MIVFLTGDCDMSIATDAADARIEAEKLDSKGVAASDRKHRLQIWPAVVLLAVFWAFFIGNHWVELSQGQRFFSRLGAHAVLFLGFLGWWLAQRSIRRRDRWLAIGVFILGSAIMLQLADPSIGVMSIFMTGLPFIFTAWLAAAYLTRNAVPQKQRLAVAASILVVLSYFLLIRWDGLDGKQRNEVSWRWSPTPEQRFLDKHRSVFFPVANSPGRWELQASDVPAFRGANRDSVVRGTDLALDWEASPPQQLWRQRIGPAWSSLIVVDGHVVTQEQRGETEVVACYDADTGAEIWAHADPVRFHEGLSGAGPRGTPAFDGGRIYVLGGMGNLHCLDAESGKLRWTHDLVKEFGATVPQWGFAVSPLVVDGRVIVFANAQEGCGLVAFDTATGEQLWKVDAGGETYSSPQLVELDGMRQILMHDNRALRGVRVDNGAVLWEHPSASEMAVPMLQPNAVGQTQLLVAIEPGVTLLEVKQSEGTWTVAEEWASNRLKPSFNDFVVQDGKVYGLDDGILCALDLATGERLWKKGRYGHGQVLLLPDQNVLLVQGARGEMVLVGIGGEQPEELGRFVAIEGKTWNHPALVGNRLYVRNGEEIACYELPVGE
jgi:outer membrane protein assembly factor BamB